MVKDLVIKAIVDFYNTKIGKRIIFFSLPLYFATEWVERKKEFFIALITFKTISLTQWVIFIAFLCSFSIIFTVNAWFLMVVWEKILKK